MIGRSVRMRLLLILLLGLCLVACSQQNAAQPPAPEVVLQAIPAADFAKIERIHDMKSWRNPYLIVRPDASHCSMPPIARKSD